jgi:hypothetical protein
VSAYQTRKSGTATEILTPDGEELTAVWVVAGDVYWEDPGAGTVHVGTPLEFHEWMVLHTKER